MKNRKLNLDQLKVSSFTTDLNAAVENTVKGGTGSAPRTFGNDCPPSRNALCTFDDVCFSKGPGCSNYQVC